MSSQQATFMLNAILKIQNNGHLDEDELIAALLQWPLTDRHLIHSFAQVLLDACNSAIYKDNRQNSRSNLPGPLSEQDGPAKQKLRIKRSRIHTDDRDTPQITALATPGPEPEVASSMLSPSSINAPSPQKDHDEKYGAESCLLQEPSLDLVSQSTEDFIRESQYEVSCFGSAENSEGTYQSLLDLIDGDAAIGERQEEEARWTDGAEWLSLLESGRNDRKKGTICYAITAIAFARWHATQVRLVKDDTTSQQASQQVSARILNSHSDNDMPRREKQRKKLNTHLARGRKWLRLAEALGLGILFRKAWKLAKSSESVVNAIIEKVPYDKKKMTVLRLLGDQMRLLLRTGRTSTDLFRNDLEKQGLASPRAVSTPGFTQLQEIQNSVTGSELLVNNTDYRFPVDSLQLLNGYQWINQDVILACLHLSDRLSFIRVGNFHIALSDQLKRPLQMAQKKVRQWRRQMKEENYLVSLFPINYNGGHWSLLEINDKDRLITNYNGSDKYIKEACKTEFPHYLYTKGNTTPQRDGHNCGPLVIRYARRRMLGRSVLEEYNEREIRAEAVRLLYSAWVSGELHTAPTTQKRKRNTEPECNSSDEDSLKDMIEISD